MKILKMILQHKYYFCFFWLIIIGISFIRVSLIESRYNIEDNFFVLTVHSKKMRNDLYYIEFYGKEKLIGYYEEFPYDIGDILEIEGTLQEIKEKTIPNVFSYKKYLQSRGIYYQLEIRKISLKKKNSNILNNLKIKMSERINSMNNKDYLYAFILGDIFFINESKKEILNNNGIIFLLSIGSFQIYLLISVFRCCRKKYRLSFWVYYIIIFIVIYIYCFLTDNKIGILKNGLIVLIEELLCYKKKKYFKLNIVFFVSSILLLCNPNYLNSISFWYSFVISIGLSLIKKSKRYYLIPFYSFLLSIPLLIYNNYEINFLSCILSACLFPIINYLVFPLCIISFIFPFMEIALKYVITIFEQINYFFNTLTFLRFIFRKTNIFIILFYYLIIIVSLKKKKMLYVFIFTLFIHYHINLFISEKLITFLDVEQGDAILVKENNNAILIDTGGNSYKNYSDNIIYYLKSLGVSKITLILSHGDYDHMGEAINLVNNFKVEKVIFNCGEFNDLENELIKVLDKKTIPYYSCIKELNIDNNKLYFLQTKEYDNENDNSNVIYTEINGYKFMFMGDAGVEKEKDILNKYNISDIDVLKVGHHGSKTSSSGSFISEMKPKYSIISVGKDNYYKHPHREVLKTLKNSKIYRTDLDGSIMFKIKNNKLKIKTCAP